MQRIYILAFLFLSTLAFAQVQVLEPVKRDTVTIQKDSVAPFADPYYREDQFYATINYNMMQSQPTGYSQYSFSTGLGVGFLRDMPLNKRRNHSIALGFGYSYNNIKHNLAVMKEGDKNNYFLAQRGSYDLNKLVLHYLEVPLELRWRNSDSISHQFWRVYAGFKLSYLVYDKAQYEPDTGGTYKVRKDDNMNKVQYSAYLSAGWNTWNFYVQYCFTPLYNNTFLDTGQKLEIAPIKLGLIFYIL